VKEPKTYSLSQAAKILGISRQAVHKAIKRQQLEAQPGTFTETITRRGLVITARSLEARRRQKG
jgi:biotin operon repressor